MSNIDWSKLITKEMRDAAAAAVALAAARLELGTRNTAAALQITRIQDRVETLGYGVEFDELTEEDKAELAQLTVSLKAWKKYKFDLGKVTAQSTWYQAPIWPTAPDVPNIAASPMLALSSSA
jgi:hypothetical protein